MNHGGWALLLAVTLTAPQSGASHCQSADDPVTCVALEAYALAQAVPAAATDSESPQVRLWLAEFARASGSAHTGEISYRSLQSVLDDLAQQDKQKADGLFARLLTWLKALFEKDGQDEAPTWLIDFLKSLESDRFKAILEALPYILGGLLLLFLAAVLYYEIRAVRQLGRGKKYQGSGEQSVVCVANAYPLSSLDAVRKLAAVEQPAALLRLCIESLIHQQSLTHDRSLTNSEMAETLAASNADLVTAFNALRGIAEDCIYGGRIPDSSQQSRAWQSAGTLLATNATEATP